MRELIINGKCINDENHPYIIAEIGHNHQGKLESALELIYAASRSGASAAKFQKRDNKSLFTPTLYNEPYNSENAFGKTYGLHREALEFGLNEYKVCIAEAKKLDIDFFATAFDIHSANFLDELGVPVFKIASGDLQNLPLLKHVASFNKPMIISTGGSNFQMIEEAVFSIRKYHNQLAILQCTASYPAKYEQLNLKVITRLREIFPENVIGYSGHDNGIAMAVVAYSLGARIIEKHFTLNRASKGTDHAFSLEPQGMQKMVRDLKRASSAMGDGEKVIYEEEKAAIRKMGKMIVAAKDLSTGHVVSESDLEYRTPADGLAPANSQVLIGRKLINPIGQYRPFQLNDFEPKE
jgi:sialic acid synthase